MTQPAKGEIEFKIQSDSFMFAFISRNVNQWDGSCYTIALITVCVCVCDPRGSPVLLLENCISLVIIHDSPSSFWLFQLSG